jgi:hypothetical protein
MEPLGPQCTTQLFTQVPCSRAKLNADFRGLQGRSNACEEEALGKSSPGHSGRWPHTAALLCPGTGVGLGAAPPVTHTRSRRRRSPLHSEPALLSSMLPGATEDSRVRRSWTGRGPTEKKSLWRSTGTAHGMSFRLLRCTRGEFR